MAARPGVEAWEYAMSTASVPIDLDAEEINEIARALWYSGILRAGIKLDVFRLLSEEGLTAEAIARRIKGDERYVQAFLDACTVLGLLRKREDRYKASPVTAKFLDPRRPEYVGDHALHHTNTWPLWGRLDEIILEGKATPPFETGFVDRDTYWSNYMWGQHNRAASGQARCLVDSLDLSNAQRLLDLGGGTASYSIAFCEANPQLHAVVVDRPEPLQIARRLVDEHGLGSRIRLIEGDFFEVASGDGYDAVLISGVVLITPEEACRRALGIAYDKLRPRGRVIVQDYMRIDHSPGRTRLDTLEDLYVLVAFDPGAGSREGEEIASWVRDAGFRDIEQIPLPTQLAVITGIRP